RPLVLVLTAISFLVTILFNADVDAQGGAYATGVLVLMMSGAFAVTLKYREEGRKVMVWFFSFITFVFIYTLIVNVLERPDGVKIASVFIASIIAISMLSRAWRSTELRTSISTITADEEAMRIIEEYRESDPNQRQGSPRRELIHLICDGERLLPETDPFGRQILIGCGATTVNAAPITREILREAESVPMRRPHVHVG
ncbi:MAG: hypothetical protein EB020_10875, partial [Proteobacteria bacterium]|nr:hypothetical protein [Pseudomonadota bacterium]